MKLIACITFGHSTDEVAAALEGAVAYARATEHCRVVALDDSSGVPPAASPGIEVLSTPTRIGFAGAVNHLVQAVAPSATRLVLINPDTAPSPSTVAKLADSDATVVVPPILRTDGSLENVRRITTAAVQTRALLFGDRFTRLTRTAPAIGGGVSSPPYAVTGTVVGLDANEVRQHPFEPVLFWLEFSDWLIRLAERNGPSEIPVMGEPVAHTGASTAVSFPLSVAASQGRAKAAFVSRYGHRGLRLLLPLGALSYGLRYALKRRSLRDGIFVMAASLGFADWRVSA